MTYTPGKLPPLQSDDAIAIAKYLEDELLRISRSLYDDIIAVEMRPTYVAPKKPRAGMLAYADGTHWNPGAGEGLYVYSIAGAWGKL